MTNLEYFADAIMHFEGWALGSVSYRNRNPGNLEGAATATGKDDRGYSIFPSLVDGYTALLEDLTAKFTGKTRTDIRPTSTILQFFQAYAPSSDHNYPQNYAAFVAQWMTVATRHPVSISTTLREIWSPPDVSQ
jgi:hypothetical protein